MLSKVVTMLHLLLAWAWHLFSFLIPRKKDLWVFIGWHRYKDREYFADNSKYLFLDVARQHELGITPVWLSNDAMLVRELRARGYAAEHESSLRGIWAALRAGTTVLDAHPLLRHWRSFGSTRLVQLWHGISIKYIGYESEYSYKRNPPSVLLQPHLKVSYDAVFAPSEWYRQTMIRSLRCDPNVVHVAPYPRNAAIAGIVKDVDIGAPSLASGGKKILYAPTFRADGSNPLEHLPPLQELLARHGATLHVLTHPKFMARAKSGDEKHVVFLDPGRDIYPALKEFSICITDYSSLGFDFLPIGPVIFFQYDRPSFEKNPGLVSEYKELLAGPVVENADELLEALDAALQGEDKYTEARTRVITRVATGGSETVLTLLGTCSEK